MKHEFKYITLDIGAVDVKIPVIEVGNNQQPSMVITCCIHGNETTSLFIIKRLLDELKSTIMIGTVKIIVISNPLASLFNTRVSPKDFQDMNRIAPGNSHGTISEMICSKIINEIAIVDYYIDMHEWSISSVLQGILIENKNETVAKQSQEIMKVFNPDAITELGEKHNKSVYGFANIKENKPGIAIEMPNKNCITDITEKRITNSIINVLGQLNITRAREGGFQETRAKYIEKMRTHTASRQGMFFPIAKLGTTLKKGDIIGYLLDLDLITKEKLCSDIDAQYLMQILDKSFVNPGDLIYTIASISKENDISKGR